MINIKKFDYNLINNNYSKKNFVIFGNGQFSKMMLFFLKYDTPFYKNLKAFVCPKEYILEKKIDNFAVIDEDNFISNYNPLTTVIFLCIGNINKNLTRKLVFEKYKSKGYIFFNYISSGTEIYSKINSEGLIIFSKTIIQPNVQIGSNVIIRSNVNISHNCKIDDHVFISNNVCVGGNTLIKEQSFIGLAAIIKDSIVISKRNFIDAASYVHISTKDDQILRGNPARAININKDKIKY
jgi:sugar O-acyltransferase (sialic acid O-acetyltransferase NeuD family)